MPLGEEFERSGAWLFQRRSYVPPLLLIGVSLAASERPGRDGVPGLEAPLALTGLAVALVGLAIRALVIGSAPGGTSGKNREAQIATTLTTTGLYSVVRHPLYLGNLCLWLGPAIAAGTWWGVVIVALAFSLYYERIMYAEEAFLRRAFGAEYLAWATATPAFIPALSRWRPAALPFSGRTVLRQEYYALASTAAMFVVLELVAVWVDSGRPGLSWPWRGLALAVFVIAGALRFLQRQTRILDVDGR
jgi:protein-S-isoprenylcysteine O-methyltransferase Ste14